MPLEIDGPGIGEQAPAFILNDSGGDQLRLVDLRGRPVVLIFYRGAW